jgi:hypothetical protein
VAASVKPTRLCDTKYLSDAFLQLDADPGPLDKDRLALKLARTSKNAPDPDERRRALRAVSETEDPIKWLALVDALCDEDLVVRLLAHRLLQCPHELRPLYAPGGGFDFTEHSVEELELWQERCWRWCVRTGKASR